MKKKAHNRYKKKSHNSLKSLKFDLQSPDWGLDQTTLLVMLVVPLSTASSEMIRMTNFKMAEGQNGWWFTSDRAGLPQHGCVCGRKCFYMTKSQKFTPCNEVLRTCTVWVAIFFPPADSDCLFAKERWPHLVAASSNFIKKSRFFFTFWSFLFLNNYLILNSLTCLADQTGPEVDF